MEVMHASNCVLGLLEYQQWEQFKGERLKLAFRELNHFRPFLLLDLIFTGGEVFFVTEYQKIPVGVGCFCSDDF